MLILRNTKTKFCRKTQEDENMISAVFIAISVFLNAIIFLLDKWVIPNYEIKNNDRPPNETQYPLKMSKWVGILLLVVSIIYGICKTSMGAYDNNKDFNKNPQVSIGGVINNYELIITEDKDSPIEFKELLVFTPEEKMIEDYIKKCSKKIIPIEELEELSSKQLNYIRNGIFAYHGLYFESGYYEKFEWYHADINSSEEFDWRVFNYFEVTNIENIKVVENLKNAY